MRLLLISPQNVYATKRLQEEAKKQKIDLTIIDIRKLVDEDFDIDPQNFDALFIRQAYLDFDQPADQKHLNRLIDLAKQFRNIGKIVVDQSIAGGDLGAGKHEALMRLQEQGISVPRTQRLIDRSGLSPDFSKGRFISNQKNIAVSDISGSAIFSYPCIAKWSYGFGMKHTYLINTLGDLEQLKQKYRAEEIILQEFIPADFEYKVITVGYQSLPVIIKLKTNHNKFLPDLNQHEVLSKDQAPEVVALAEQSSKILKRELAKVDILQAHDQLYVLEVNRWPGLQYFEKTTKFNVAAEFLRYIKRRL